MRHGLRAAFGAAALLITATTGCTSGGGSSAPPSASRAPASAAAPTPSPPDLTEVINAARTTVLTKDAAGAYAPGPQGLMLVEAWSTGAAFAWETNDQRLCTATAGRIAIRERACGKPPATSPGSVHSLHALFTDGWVRMLGVDHAELTSATCGGEPLKVTRVGTVTSGPRTLYAVWFPDYTQGSMTLSVRHDGTTSEAAFLLGHVGDRTCAANS